MENEEFVTELGKCETESEMENLRNKYAASIKVEDELEDEDLEEVVGGGMVCNFLGNCKYICKECGKTFATQNMANFHWFSMSFRGGGLKHTIKEINR